MPRNDSRDPHNDEILKVRNKPNVEVTPKTINDINANNANSCDLIVASITPVNFYLFLQQPQLKIDVKK